MHGSREKRGSETIHIREALDRVITYNWEDELEDFKENLVEQECHIFTDLVVLRNWVNGENHSVDYWAGEDLDQADEF